MSRLTNQINMKKLFRNYFTIVALLGVVLFNSCQKEDFGTVTTEPILEENSINRQVSSTQAKAFASMMANNLFSSEENGAQLKSATANVNRSIEGLSAIVAEDKDTVLFSVNFSNNKGFMLISGDKGDAPIVALSDSGAFDINNLNPTIEIWLKQQKELISAQMKEPLNESEDEHSLWYGIANDTSQVEIEFVGNLPELKSCPTGEKPSGRTTVYPYTGMVNKWGQGTGYNFNAPIRGALAGCPAVAIGQLCFNQMFPNDYYYAGMPYELPSNYNRQNSISLMLRDIGDNIPGYSWSTTSSGATPDNILTGLKRIGYSNAKLDNYNLASVYNDLKKGVPVLLAAHQNGSYQGGAYLVL